MNSHTYYSLGLQGGRSWAAGVLMLEGDTWSKDAPIWQCEHRHAEVAAALACAEVELARRRASVNRR